jgi:formamidopyrimidine-DNA glycosylase
MPELPEVEIVRRRLWPCLRGLVLADVEVLDPTVSRQSQDELAALLVGRRVAALRRRGKYLIVDLGDARLVVHLRMTGRLLFTPEKDERRPRLRLAFAPATSLYFYDVRRFGRVWALRPEEEAAFFSGLGVEPLDEAFSPQALRALMVGRRAPLKAFLLDQRRLAGVGNIYADEALFRAGLHPLLPAGDVGPHEAQRLHAAIVATLQLGIEHEGSSVESFVDPAGERGHFQEILNVYQRTGEPCRVCGTAIRRLTVGGRGTHYCPRCQPRRSPRRRKARRGE